jgi:hypothetical protein
MRRLRQYRHVYLGARVVVPKHEEASARPLSDKRRALRRGELALDELPRSLPPVPLYHIVLVCINAPTHSMALKS